MDVLLLHPLPFDAQMWDEVAKLLDRTIIAPTLYDLGDRIEDWAHGVLAMLDGPVVAVGNSVGGSCAIELARLAPEMVRHLVLIGAKAGHRPEPDFRDRAIRLLRTEGAGAAWRTYWEPLLGPGTPRQVRGDLGRAVAQQAVEDLVRGVNAFHTRPDRSAFLRSWTGPVTVVCGEHDINPARAQEEAGQLVDGRFVLLPGVGHYAPVEAPSAVAALIER